MTATLTKTLTTKADECYRRAVAATNPVARQVWLGWYDRQTRALRYLWQRAAR